MPRAPAIAVVIVALAAAILWYSRPRSLFTPSPAPPGDSTRSADDEALFEVAPATDAIGFIHSAGPARGDYFFPQIMGSGCALFDFDRDGDLDLYLIDGSPEGDAKPIAPGNLPGNRLYRNEGNATFVDISAGSGLDIAAIGMGVAVGDVDNDGYPDVYITNYGGDRLFVNHGGDGTFVDITKSAGIDNTRWGASCSFVDYDRDGWLDLVVVNYVDYRAPYHCVEPNGAADYCNPKLFYGTPAKLYRNETGRPAFVDDARAVPDARLPAPIRFRDVSLESQIALLPGPGLGVVCADFNGDRWPDIFVANDAASNFLWINGQDGTFREEAVLRGVACDRLGRPQANMGVALGDADCDGAFDLGVTHLGGEGIALYRSRGSGSFEESAAAAGLMAPSFRQTGFGAAFLDIDHDGTLDLAVVNGRVKRPDGAPLPKFLPGGPPASASGFWAAYAERNQLFLNDGSGRFREFNSAAEHFTREARVGRGLAVGDIDNDGDLDLVVMNAAGPVQAFRNVAHKKGHWLTVRAIEPAVGGRDALGALVTLVAGERKWVRPVNAGGSYLSSSDPRTHFGLGPVEAIDRIEIIWPDGSDEVFEGGDVDRFVTIEHGRGSR